MTDYYNFMYLQAIKQKLGREHCLDFVKDSKENALSKSVNLRHL